jgi:hypothetical protein
MLMARHLPCGCGFHGSPQKEKRPGRGALKMPALVKAKGRMHDPNAFMPEEVALFEASLLNLDRMV